ncbi:nitroalkane oxidase [Nocardiopsis sp. Huas11]|uniref:nitronate monooxygenase n=1 Tax=Nocardiopsis sp. Huas11 TaxID=2183912 RepID=UPI000EAFD749|nr:nitronate monooxygenase [Nocardiopsis sp. Huas11]RKS05920.1 nitroalkane oxidase [Nocardiopsis sp. Huas11]
MALKDLLAERPLIQAPMAGGASTPALVAAVAGAGGTGFLAAGYRTAQDVADQVRAVREGGTSAFGVNVFVPSPAVAAPAELGDLRTELAAESRRYGTELGEPRHDDDAWRDKIDLLCDLAVPLVTFTFGCPDAAVLERLRRAGSATMITVTTVAEARVAVERGTDGVCVQGLEAGGHRGCYDPRTGGDRPLPDLLPDVVEAVGVPVVATGGLMTGADVAAVLDAGAHAAQLGTAFLRCPESGAQPAHKAALADPDFTETAVTWAFTGRPARGLVNRFVREHPGERYAYPEVHHMTRPLRAAAAAEGDPGGMALWAGQGFRAAEERPAVEIVARLREEAAARGRRI